jgi:hypothetical protein
MGSILVTNYDGMNGYLRGNELARLDAVVVDGVTFLIDEDFSLGELPGAEPKKLDVAYRVVKDDVQACTARVVTVRDDSILEAVGAEYVRQETAIAEQMAKENE